MKLHKLFALLLAVVLLLSLCACAKRDTQAVTTTPPATTTAPPQTSVPPATSIPSYEISLGMTMGELREIMGSDGDRLDDHSAPRYSWILADGRVLTVTLQEPDPETEPRFARDWLVSEFKIDDSPYFTVPSSIVITPAEVIPPTVPESCELSLGMTLREVNKIMGSDGERISWDSMVRYTWKLADDQTLTLTFRRSKDAPTPIELPTEWVVAEFRIGDSTSFTEPSTMTITVSPAQPETEK